MVMAKGSRRRGVGKGQMQKNYRPGPEPGRQSGHRFSASEKYLLRRSYYKLPLKLL